MSDAIGNVRFDLIRYANCWEDADLLLEALQAIPGKRFLCIASAGDNALALLTTRPAQVTAIDISEVQLHLCRLKQACFMVLEHAEMLCFLGVTAGNKHERIDLYQKLKPALDEATAQYWNDNISLISKGVIHAGKFERYFAFFRNRLLPFVHSKRTTAQLLLPKTEEQQKVFYRTHWNTWRWRLLMNMFFSKAIMGKYGRDPQFLKHVQVPVHQYIREKAAAHLCMAAAPSNYFLRYIFTGHFGAGLPCYLRPENFEVIRNNIDRIRFIRQSADAAVATDVFDACCLSNIFEYFSVPDFEAAATRWAGQLAAGTQLLFWNLMAYRSFSELQPALYQSIHPPDMIDKGFFYSRFLHERKC